MSEPTDPTLKSITESDKSDDEEESTQKDSKTSEQDLNQQVPGGYCQNIIEHQVDINPNHLRYQTKHFNRFSDSESKEIVATENSSNDNNKNIITNITFDVHLNDSTKLPTSNFRHIELQSKVNKLGELESSVIKHQIGEPMGSKVASSPAKVIIESNGKMSEEHILDSPQYLIETEFNREQKYNAREQEEISEQELDEMREEMITPLLETTHKFNLERRDLSLSRMLAAATLITIIFSLICYFVLPLVVSPDDCKFSNDILIINQKPIDQDTPLAF